MARSLLATSSQSISVASAPSINFGGGDYTVGAWVRFPVEPPNDSMVVGKRAGGFDGDEGWELKIADGGNGKVEWDHQTDITGRQRADAEITGLVDGDWHLLVGDHTDGTPSQLQIWYDGAVVGTKVANTPGSVDTTTPMVIGAAFNTPDSNYLTGEIGLVFACNRVLSLAEHQWLALGFSPRFLNPRPCFLMELTSRVSPEPDIGAGGLFGTLAGSPPVVAGPSIIYPRAAEAAPDTWYEPIEATISGQSLIVATSTRGRKMVATVAGQSSIVADATASVAVEATIAGQSALAAALSADARARATIAGQSTITADAELDAHIRAVINGQSTLAAAMSYNAEAVAFIVAQSAISATASADVPVAATIAGQSAIAADIARSPTIAAQIDGQSTVAGVIVVDAGIKAEIGALGTFVATPSADVPISTAIAAASGLTARLSAEAPVSATIAGQSAIAANATRGRSAAATIDSQSTVVAIASADVPVVASINAVSGLAANLSAEVPIAAAIGGQSSIVARLSRLGEPGNRNYTGEVSWRTTTGGGFS